MLSIDKKIFEDESEVRARMIEYGKLFDELHIVVFTKRKLQTNHKLQIPNTNVFLYPTNSLSKFSYFSNTYKICKKIIKNNSVDIITSQDAFTNLVAIKLKYKFKNIKLQIQIHTDFLSRKFRKESMKNFFRYRGYIKGIKNADCIRVVSESMKNKLTQQFGIDSSKIFVLPIFVDIEKIRNTPITVDLHKKYPQFEKIVLIASRLEKEKNIQLAISAIQEVIKKYPKTGLVIVGDGSRLKSLKAESERLKEGIVFEGWQEKQTIYSYYKTADLFLITSDYEGYGLTIIEALATGLPVLSTDVGIAREMGALIVDRDSIAKNIVKYIEDKPISRATLDIKYPYKNKQDYLDKFKQSFICAS